VISELGKIMSRPKFSGALPFQRAAQFLHFFPFIPLRHSLVVIQSTYHTLNIENSTFYPEFLSFNLPTLTIPSAMAPNVDLSKRRRFQPPITTFFTSATQPVSSDAPSVSHHHHYAAATFSATPVVPAKVQSSLMSVGMRVRKSVAEGYRTNMTKTQEKISLATPVAQTPTTQPHLGVRQYSELAPFSGAGKSSFSNDDYLVTDDGDAFSIPASSQDSIDSFSGTPGGQKRALEVDDIFADEDDDEFYTSWQDNSVGRTILSPNLGQSRRILAIRSSKVQQPTMDVDDFEEASFLRRREEVDAEDVRMYGA
jgi:hypothetical protein